MFIHFNGHAVTLNHAVQTVLETLTQTECPVLELVSELEKLPSPCVAILPLLTTHCPQYRNTLHTIAHKVDTVDGYAYHNKHHAAKVTLFSYLLARHHNIPVEQCAILFMTALGHDYRYTIGECNMEFKSIRFLFDEGAFPNSEIAFSCAVLNEATHIAWRNAIGDNETTISIKHILSDADMISSAALSYKQFNIETARVEQETGTRFSAMKRFQFLKSVGTLKSCSGTYFQRQQAAILEHVEHDITISS